jgi:glycosyltransferase involved in cell wall biosynthesis
LPADKLIFLFVAESLDIKRKGFDLLLLAINELNSHNMIFCAIGETKSEDQSNIHYFGKVTDDEKLALIYSASDAFILPSREDNLPNVLLESLACGTPVIATPVGGTPEIIQDGINGYLTEDVSVEALKKAIILFSQTSSIFNMERIRASAIDMFSSKKQALKYIEIYRKHISGTK